MINQDEFTKEDKELIKKLVKEKKEEYDDDLLGEGCKDLLGEGNFGIVMKIEIKGKNYAAKIINKQVAELNLNQEELKKLVERELSALKIMSECENSVKLYDYFEEEDYYIFILELCDKTLNDCLKERNFNNQEILSIMIDLNKAFKIMNKNNIIHRDIKPTNIMIKYIDSSKTKYIPKIIDYGVSREIEDGNASTICGSPGFMAPEIPDINKKKYKADKVDLYSIGALIYLMYFKKKYSKKDYNKIEEKLKRDNPYNELFKELLVNLLNEDPNKRLSWDKYFNHPFFNQNKINIYKIINVDDYILENIVIQSYDIKKENEIDLKQYPEKFISITECLEYEDKKDDHFFILGILAKYFEKLGISTIIEKDDLPRNKKIRNFHKILFQFICNGYLLKNKYILHFGLNDDRRTELVKDLCERCKFNEKLKNLMLIKYKLKDEEFIITNYRMINGQFTAILIFKSNFNKNIIKKELIEIFKNDEDLKYLTSIEKELIIPSIRLNRSLLDNRGDNKEKDSWGKYKKRGGEQYYPPYGWIRYGLRVDYCYDNKNNNWITFLHEKEWCIAYCGLRSQIKQNYENDNDIKHPGKKVGIGVYCHIKPDKMKENTEAININGNNYKIGLMVRVKPDKIRCPENNQEMWVVNGNDDDFRPYGILIKKNE